MSCVMLKRTNLIFEQIYIRNNLFSHSHRFHVNTGRTNDYFAFILKENVHYPLEGRSIFIPEGSLYYLPQACATLLCGRATPKSSSTPWAALHL